MKKLFLFCFIVLASLAFSQSKKLWLEQADNFFFKKKDYASALLYYQKVLDDTSVMETYVFPYEAQLVNLAMKGVKDTTIKNVDIDSLKKASRKDYIVHQIGHCFKLTYNYAAAVTWFKNSADRNSYIEDKFYYGEALMHERKYDEAIKSIEEYVGSKPKNDSLLKLAQQDMAGCYFSLDSANVHKQIRVRLCDTATINHGTASFAPVYWGSSSKIVFTSARHGGVLTDPEKQQSEFLCDLYWAEKKDSGWGKVHTFGRPVNTGLHDGAGVMDADEVMYFTRWTDANRNEASIYMARGTQGHFYEAQKLGPIINLPGYRSQMPFVTFDATTMFWVSDRPGGKGGLDIWTCKLDDNGLPIAPIKNLGEPVNTPGDEITPFWHLVTANLFYSSNGHPGFGGLDIMKSAMNLDDSTFAIPVNLGRPINSSKDDAYMILDRLQQTGYFSSDREECVGGHCYDIYEFDNEPIEFDLSGVVTDADTQEPIASALVTMKNVHEDEEPVFFITDEKGFYSTPVKGGVEYFMKAQKNKYLASAASLSTMGYTQSKHFVQNFELHKIPKDDVPIEGIEYDLNKFTLRPESKLVLDKIYDFLVLNENLSIEINSHTDTRGSTKANQILSDGRAKSCVDYLISRGIAKERLISKGYGETKPLFDDKTVYAKPTKEEQEPLHQKNRRTAFRIIGEGVLKSTDNQ
ncbi:MAG: OmpA family protein [Bacteroidia bacterium]|nr:OmpA family protein [Bacteroidia bacterium]